MASPDEQPPTPLANLRRKTQFASWLRKAFGEA